MLANNTRQEKIQQEEKREKDRDRVRERTVTGETGTDPEGKR